MNTSGKKNICSNSKTETLEQTMNFAQSLKERHQIIFEFHS